MKKQVVLTILETLCFCALVVLSMLSKTTFSIAIYGASAGVWFAISAIRLFDLLLKRKDDK